MNAFRRSFLFATAQDYVPSSLNFRFLQCFLNRFQHLDLIDYLIGLTICFRLNSGCSNYCFQRGQSVWRERKQTDGRTPPTPQSIRFMTPCFYKEPFALRIVYCMKTFPLRIKLFVQFLIDKVSDSVMCRGEEEKNQSHFS